jgi:proteic killer suppression protein
VVVRFRHKGLERLFTSGDTSSVNAQHVRKLSVILAALNTATTPANMNLPGLRLHPLKGDRQGQWAVMVSGNWRLLFEFEGSNATNVDLVDYH